VQYKHHAKDRRAVERDYAEVGYSTRWLSFDSFGISRLSGRPSTLQTPIFEARLFADDVHRLDRPEAPIYVTQESNGSDSRLRALSVGAGGGLVFHREIRRWRYNRLRSKYQSLVCEQLWPSRFEDLPAGWNNSDRDPQSAGGGPR
jgi:hypothetical protein